MNRIQGGARSRQSGQFAARTRRRQTGNVHTSASPPIIGHYSEQNHSQPRPDRGHLLHDGRGVQALPIMRVCCENASPTGTPTIRIAPPVREPPPGELGRPPVGTAARRAAGGSLPSAFTGPRHRARSAANGVCRSNVRITPNAGIPAEKGPPRNSGSFPPPAFGGLCRPEVGPVLPVGAPVRPSLPCTFGVPRLRLFVTGGVCRRTRS